jgi:hypothetical protein
MRRRLVPGAPAKSKGWPEVPIPPKGRSNHLATIVDSHGDRLRAHSTARRSRVAVSGNWVIVPVHKGWDELCGTTKSLRT